MAFETIKKHSCDYCQFEILLCQTVKPEFIAQVLMRHENFQPDLQLQDFHILEQCNFLSLHNDKKKANTVFTSIYSVVDHPNNS